MLTLALDHALLDRVDLRAIDVDIDRLGMGGRDEDPDQGLDRGEPGFGDFSRNFVGRHFRPDNVLDESIGSAFGGGFREIHVDRDAGDEHCGHCGHEYVSGDALVQDCISIDIGNSVPRA